MSWYEYLHFLVRVWRYRYKGEEFGIAYMLSRELAGKTVIDIGAHHGIYSYWMHRHVGAAGKVFAFEPQPELINYLHGVKKSYGLGNLQIEPMGLSCEPGELILRRPHGHSGGASFTRFKTGRDDIDLIPVQVTTLDRYFGRHAARPISFIKCDVEEHELEVFRGGQQILTEDRPDLLFECLTASRPNVAVFDYLQSIGYTGYCFGPAGLAPVGEFRELLPKIHKRARKDFVFVPRERAMGALRRAA
jgi:FkbM family methyltransferase